MKRTSLYAFHERHGARFVPFGGWEMPVQYSGIIEEHKAVRKQVGLFDVSHMGEASVTGPDAERFLNTVCTNDIAKLVDGKALYTVVCYPDGGCVDDVLVYRIAENDYMVVLNASNIEKDMEWLRTHVADLDVKVRDVSDDYALLAVQGPSAVALVADLAEGPVGDLKRFTFTKTKVAGVECIASRTGYTGEDGFELYCPPTDAEKLAEALLAAGEPKGLKLAGLGARDSLRLEAGLPLYGHEIGKSISPMEAGLGWVVKLKKEEPFIGKDALASQKERGAPRGLVFFKLEGRRIARPGAPVVAGDETVGEVVSGTFSPMVEQPIGSALVKTAASDGGVDLEVDLRGKRSRMLLAKPPLHKA